MTDPSNSFHLLDDRIQRYLWAEGWELLREAQEQAIPLILNADQDVIVAAATASGKTEAAFLPALTHLLESNELGLIVYVSPLKALINDQFGRLDRLCEQLEIPVWSWHGDISATTKTKFLKKREGVLLITPESLEALLCNRGSSVAAIFERTAYFIVDELHAFIGAERGKQLQSLLHRIDHAVGRRIPRIGLSATLGDMNLAAQFLRPDGSAAIVDSKEAGNGLRVLVKGYEEPLVVNPPAKLWAAHRPPDADESLAQLEPEDGDVVAGDEAQEPTEVTPGQIAEHLFTVLRGTNNLVFPNSRREVERYTHLLNKMCLQRQVPNEFWPHHGSLSKEIRSETEAALKQKDRPATAICTNTLELGIDIGAVKSVVQIGAPPSVAGMRQRLGRSGRRKGEPAILRGFCIEDALGGTVSLDTELRLGTAQMTAMVLLMGEGGGWFEPPRTQGAHFSTLIQQVLSCVAQTGGATIAELYALLCASGCPFEGVSKKEFMLLIQHLGQKDLLMQESSGLLLHAPLGEKFVNHYTFYAAFASDEEFRVVAGGRTLGSLPVSQLLTVGQRILFAGKTWRVEEIDEPQKTIHVARSGGGRPPMFVGGAGRCHTRVRQRMRELLQSEEMPAFLDSTAKRLLAEGQRSYAARGLAQEYVVDQGREVQLLTWLGDAANEAIACLLIRRGFTATPSGPGVEVQKATRSTRDILNALGDAAMDEPPPLEMLLADVKNLHREKWDWALPDALLRRTYASLNLDLTEALDWARSTAAA